MLEYRPPESLFEVVANAPARERNVGNIRPLDILIQLYSARGRRFDGAGSSELIIIEG